jgi:DNA-binding beta-propeller fold protein YncE
MQTYAVAVDPQNNVYVADLNNFVNMYDSSGAYLRQFMPNTGFLEIEGVAVDSYGDVYFPAFNDATYPINSYILK